MRGLEALRGRRALVTGASSGIGREIARQLAAAGASVVLVARRKDALERLADEIRAGTGVDVEVVALDLTAAGAIEDLASRLGPIDVLVNNAGFGTFGSFLDIPWERTAAMLDLDVRALVHLTRAIVPGMVARGSGYVLLISSIGAYQPTPTYAAYAAAKGFVLSFGVSLGWELRGTGASCTVLSPGVTATEFLEVAGQKPTLYQRIMMMRADRVARIGLRAMVARRSSVVPGLMNKIATWSMRFLPLRLAAAIAWLAMRSGPGREAGDGG